MYNNWELLIATADLQSAEILKALLLEHDIAAVIRNNKDSSYNNFGECEIFVTRNDIIKAKFVLDNNK